MGSKFIRSQQLRFTNGTCDGTSSSLFDMTVRMLSIATAMMFLPKNSESNSKTFTKKDVLCTNRDVTKSE